MTVEGEDFKEGKIPDPNYTVVTPSSYHHTVHVDPDFVVSPDGKFDLWATDEPIKEAEFTCPVCESSGPHPYGWFLINPDPENNSRWAVVQCVNCRAFHWFELGQPLV